MAHAEEERILATIKWAHAVNSQMALNTVLLDTDIEMIEADVTLGTLKQTDYITGLPIMAHPPATISDISLAMFLDQINEYNDDEDDNPIRAIKLDFKSIEVFEASIDTLKIMVPQLHAKIWLNADILKGPVNATDTLPVNPQRFFAGCVHFDNSVLSLGWTTHIDEDMEIGSYTDENVNEMLNIITAYNIHTSGQELTFPVRAGLAANSKPQLLRLLDTANQTNRATLTIWSAPNDYVDIEKLYDLIYEAGVTRVYIDVPPELAAELDALLSEFNEPAAHSTFRTSFFSLLLASASFFFFRISTTDYRFRLIDYSLMCTDSGFRILLVCILIFCTEMSKRRLYKRFIGM